MSSPDFKKLSVAALLALGLSTSLAACASDDKADSGGTESADAASGDKIKVGVLQSLSGTMSISEVAVRDSELMAIEEINAKGGVLGKQLEPVVEDGASD
ncbi:MAG: transporter substrate-binding protein, partial [Solirubrobacteraceae bacterium]|nr:transporter substrate-binding protein [Solirubrobacteraceae bacterium]